MRGVRTPARLLWRGALLLGVVCFLLGPASGVARAIHLAHSTPHHSSHHCPVCVQMTLGSIADVVDPPTLIDQAKMLLFDSVPPAQAVVLTIEYAWPTPRAPPLLS